MEKTTQVAIPTKTNSENAITEDVTPQKSHEVLELPVLPIRNSVLTPKLLIPLLVGRNHSIKAVEEAMQDNGDHSVFVVAQMDEDLEDPGCTDIYEVGVEGHIERVLKMPDGSLNVLVRGQRRLRRLAYTQETPFMRVRAEVLEEELPTSLGVEAMRRAVLALFEKCVRLSSSLGDEAYIAALNLDSPGLLADFVVSALDVPVLTRQVVLELTNIEERLQQASILLSQELDILELESRIHHQVQQEVDKTQREYFLREQLRAIQRELGEGDPSLRE